MGSGRTYRARGLGGIWRVIVERGICVAGIVLVSLLFCSCATVEPERTLTMTEVAAPAGKGRATKDSRLEYLNEDISVNFRLLDRETIEVLLISRTQEPIRIVWDSSAYISASGAYRKLGGRHGQPMYPIVILPRSQMRELSRSTEEVYWGHFAFHWKLKGLFSKNSRSAKIGMKLALKIGDMYEQYWFWFQIGVAT